MSIEQINQKTIDRELAELKAREKASAKVEEKVCVSENVFEAFLEKVKKD